MQKKIASVRLLSVNMQSNKSMQCLKVASLRTSVVWRRRVSLYARDCRVDLERFANSNATFGTEIVQTQAAIHGSRHMSRQNQKDQNVAPKLNITKIKMRSSKLRG
jgi:hypothetical protein